MAYSRAFLAFWQLSKWAAWEIIPQPRTPIRTGSGVFFMRFRLCCGERRINATLLFTFSIYYFLLITAIVFRIIVMSLESSKSSLKILNFPAKTTRGALTTASERVMGASIQTHSERNRVIFL